MWTNSSLKDCCTSFLTGLPVSLPFPMRSASLWQNITGSFSLLRILGILLQQLVQYKSQSPPGYSNIVVFHMTARVILINKIHTTQLLFSKSTPDLQLHLNGIPALPNPDKSLSPSLLQMLCNSLPSLVQTFSASSVLSWAFFAWIILPSTLPWDPCTKRLTYRKQQLPSLPVPLICLTFS